MKSHLRRLLHSLVALALRLRSRPYTPPSASRCVVLAPHQDDEALGCAGLILAHRAAGLSVDILYLTDGAGSHPEHPLHPPAAIAALRRAEATRALSLLGVEADRLHFLDTPDGTLARLAPTDAEALVTRLAAQLVALAPTELFLPCRDDRSSEHIAAFRLTLRALRLAGLQPRLLEYPVWARWSPRGLVRPWLLTRRIWRVAFPSALATKRAALAAYVSQNEPTPPWTAPVLPSGFVASFATPEEFFFER